LLEEVGSGTYGRVHRAWDPQLECEIAIKILHRHVTDVIPEGRTLAKVRDPNVVSVLGLETHGDRIGLCMEFVHGQTLKNRLGAMGTLSAQEAMLVGQDVCRALVAVHRAGFVHRDVKAQTSCARDGRIVLMDFGTGRKIEHLERAKAEGLAGTELYMAPEVLAGQPASPRSDIYSVGVLLYHLVTRRFPVEGTTREDLRAAHMFGKRTPVSEHNGHLPAAFISVLDHALAANPQQRCSSAGELLEALATANSDVFGHSDRTRTIAVAAAKLAVTLAAITAFGAVNSPYFNDALGRSEFARESIVDWFGWGVSSLVAPTVPFMFALLALALLLAFRQFPLGASKRAQVLEDSLKATVRRWHLMMSEISRPARSSSLQLCW
jgi:serine/threonine protein kinase